MSECCDHEEVAGLERRTLQLLLAINFAMFMVEAGAGWWGDSTGLLADSIDMLSDAAVYGIALYAVGRSLHPIRPRSRPRRRPKGCLHHFVSHPAKEEGIGLVEVLDRVTMQVFVCGDCR
jgi:hypothetical protein